jgi:AcrR family transcriptional regulator
LTAEVPRDSIRRVDKPMQKPPRDERRAIESAAKALIRERGFARLTPADVVSRAKVSDIAFRAEFPDMDALLKQLSLSFAEQMIATTDAATQQGIWKGAAARDVVEVAVRSIVDVVLDEGYLVRELLAAGAREPAFAKDLERIGRHLSSRLVTVMAECTNVPVRPARSIAFSLLLTVSLAHHHVLVGDDWAGVVFTKEQLTEEAARAVCAYLGLSPTIAIKEDGPDVAPTEMVAAVTTEHVSAARARGGAERGE